MITIELLRSLMMRNRIEFTRHAARRLMKRKVTLEQIASAIYSGEIIEENPDTVVVSGYAKGADKIEFSCTVVEDTIRVITVFPPK